MGNEEYIIVLSLISMKIPDSEPKLRVDFLYQLSATMIKYCTQTI